METNYYNQDEQRMMREEYGRDFGGCLWGLVACLLAVAGIVAIMASL